MIFYITVKKAVSDEQASFMFQEIYYDKVNDELTALTLLQDNAEVIEKTHIKTATISVEFWHHDKMPKNLNQINLKTPEQLDEARKQVKGACFYSLPKKIKVSSNDKLRTRHVFNFSKKITSCADIENLRKAMYLEPVPCLGRFSSQRSPKNVFLHASLAPNCKIIIEKAYLTDDNRIFVVINLEDKKRPIINAKRNEISAGFAILVDEQHDQIKYFVKGAKDLQNFITLFDNNSKPIKFTVIKDDSNIPNLDVIEETDILPYDYEYETFLAKPKKSFQYLNGVDDIDDTKQVKAKNDAVKNVEKVSQPISPKNSSWSKSNLGLFAGAICGAAAIALKLYTNENNLPSYKF